MIEVTVEVFGSDCVDKCSSSGFIDYFHNSFDLVPGYDRVDKVSVLTRISAASLKDGGAVVRHFVDLVGYFLRLVRYNKHGLLLITLIKNVYNLRGSILEYD